MVHLYYVLYITLSKSESNTNEDCYTDPVLVKVIIEDSNLVFQVTPVYLGHLCLLPVL